MSKMNHKNPYSNENYEISEDYINKIVTEVFDIKQADIKTINLVYELPYYIYPAIYKCIQDTLRLEEIIKRSSEWDMQTPYYLVYMRKQSENEYIWNPLDFHFKSIVDAKAFIELKRPELGREFRIQKID